MNEDDIREALNELSEEVMKVGEALKLKHNENAHDLELLSRSLIRCTGTLESIVNVMIDKQL